MSSNADEPPRKVVRGRNGEILFVADRTRKKGPDGKLLPLYHISPADARRAAAEHDYVQRPTMPWMLSYGGWAHTPSGEAPLEESQPHPTAGATRTVVRAAADGTNGGDGAGAELDPGSRVWHARMVRERWVGGVAAPSRVMEAGAGGSDDGSERPECNDEASEEGEDEVAFSLSSVVANVESRWNRAAGRLPENWGVADPAKRSPMPKWANWCGTCSSAFPDADASFCMSCGGKREPSAEWLQWTEDDARKTARRAKGYQTSVDRHRETRPIARARRPPSHHDRPTWFADVYGSKARSKAKAAAKAKADGIDDDAGAQWEQAFDEFGAEYWFNTRTQESRWDRPAILDEGEGDRMDPALRGALKLELGSAGFGSALGSALAGSSASAGAEADSTNGAGGKSSSALSLNFDRFARRPSTAPRARDEELDEELLEAARCNDSVAFEELIRFSGDAWRGARDVHQNGCLILACRAGYIKSVRRLIELGADIDQANMYGNTPLHEASRWGHVSVITLLLDTARTDGKKKHYGMRERPASSMSVRTAAPERSTSRGGGGAGEGGSAAPSTSSSSASAFAGVLQAVPRPGSSGARASGSSSSILRPNSRSRPGSAGLRPVSPQRATREEVSYLERKNNAGVTALHLAARWGRSRAMRMLLDHGAHVDGTPPPRSLADLTASRLRKGRTALHDAALNGHLGAIQLLCERGADPVASDGNGRNPRNEAIDQAQTHVWKWLLPFAQHRVDHPMSYLMRRAFWNSRRATSPFCIVLRCHPDANPRDTDEQEWGPAGGESGDEDNLIAVHPWLIAARCQVLANSLELLQRHYEIRAKEVARQQSQVAKRRELIREERARELMGWADEESRLAQAEIAAQEEDVKMTRRERRQARRDEAAKRRFLLHQAAGAPRVLIELGAQKLDRQTILETTDPYVVIRRRDPHSGARVNVMKSECVINRRNPKWQAQEIDMETACGWDMDTTLEVLVYDYDSSDPVPDFIGGCTITLRELIVSSEVFAASPPGRKKKGMIPIINPAKKAEMELAGGRKKYVNSGYIMPIEVLILGVVNEEEVEEVSEDTDEGDGVNDDGTVIVAVTGMDASEWIGAGDASQSMTYSGSGSGSGGSESGSGSEWGESDGDEAKVAVEEGAKGEGKEDGESAATKSETPKKRKKKKRKKKKKKKKRSPKAHRRHVTDTMRKHHDAEIARNKTLRDKRRALIEKAKRGEKDDDESCIDPESVGTAQRRSRRAERRRTAEMGEAAAMARSGGGRHHHHSQGKNQRPFSPDSSARVRRDLRSLMRAQQGAAVEPIIFDLKPINGEVFTRQAIRDVLFYLYTDSPPDDLVNIVMPWEEVLEPTEILANIQIAIEMGDDVAEKKRVATQSSHARCNRVVEEGARRRHEQQVAKSIALRVKQLLWAASALELPLLADRVCKMVEAASVAQLRRHIDAEKHAAAIKAAVRKRAAEVRMKKRRKRAAASRQTEVAGKYWYDPTIRARLCKFDKETGNVNGVVERLNRETGTRVKYFGSQVIINGISPLVKQHVYNDRCAEVLQVIKCPQDAKIRVPVKYVVCVNRGDAIEDPVAAFSTILTLSEKYINLDEIRLNRPENPWKYMKEEKKAKTFATKEMASDVQKYGARLLASVACEILNVLIETSPGSSLPKAAGQHRYVFGKCDPRVMQLERVMLRHIWRMGHRVMAPGNPLTRLSGPAWGFIELALRRGSLPAWWVGDSSNTVAERMIAAAQGEVGIPDEKDDGGAEIDDAETVDTEALWMNDEVAERERDLVRIERVDRAKRERQLRQEREEDERRAAEETKQRQRMVALEQSSGVGHRGGGLDAHLAMMRNTQQEVVIEVEDSNARPLTAPGFDAHLDLLVTAIDTNRDGWISHKEIIEALLSDPSLHFEIESATHVADRAVVEGDTNGDGLLSYTEFCSLAPELLNRMFRDDMYDRISQSERRKSNMNMMGDNGTAASAKAARIPLPENEWVQCISGGGHPYWYNYATCESSWDNPYGEGPMGGEFGPDLERLTNAEEDGGEIFAEALEAEKRQEEENAQCDLTRKLVKFYLNHAPHKIGRARAVVRCFWSGDPRGAALSVGRLNALLRMRYGVDMDGFSIVKQIVGEAKGHRSWDGVVALDQAQGITAVEETTSRIVTETEVTEDEEEGDDTFGELPLQRQTSVALGVAHDEKAQAKLAELHGKMQVRVRRRTLSAIHLRQMSEAAHVEAMALAAAESERLVVPPCVWRRDFEGDNHSGHEYFYNTQSGLTVWEAPRAFLDWEHECVVLEKGLLEGERCKMSLEDHESRKVEDHARRHPNVLLEEDMERELRARLGLVEMDAWTNGEGGGAVKRVSAMTVNKRKREVLPSGEPLPSSLTERWASGERESTTLHAEPTSVVLLGSAMIVDKPHAKVPNFEHGDASILPLSIAVWHGATLADAEVGLCDTEGILVGRIPSWLLSLHTNHTLLGDMLGAFSRSHIVSNKARAERRSKHPLKRKKKKDRSPRSFSPRAASPVKINDAAPSSDVVGVLGVRPISASRDKRVAFKSDEVVFGMTPAVRGGGGAQSLMLEVDEGGEELSTPSHSPISSPRPRASGPSPRSPRRPRSPRSPRSSRKKREKKGAKAGINRVSILTGCSASTVKWLTGFIFSGAGSIMAPRVPSPGVAAELLPLSLVLRLHAVQACLEQSLLHVTSPAVVLLVLEAVMMRCAGGEFDCGDVLLNGTAIDMTPKALAAGGDVMDKRRMGRAGSGIVGTGRPISAGDALHGSGVAADHGDMGDEEEEEFDDAGAALDGVALSALLKTRAMAPCRICLTERWIEAAPHVGNVLDDPAKAPVTALALWMQYVVARALPTRSTYDLLGMVDPRVVAANKAKRARDLKKAKKGSTFSFFAELHDEPTDNNGAFLSDGSAGGDGGSDNDSFDEAERPQSAYSHSNVQFRLKPPPTAVANSTIWDRLAERKQQEAAEVQSAALADAGFSGTLADRRREREQAAKDSAAVAASLRSTISKVCIAAAGEDYVAAIRLGDRLLGEEVPRAVAELPAAKLAFEAANAQQKGVLRALHQVEDGSSSEDDDVGGVGGGSGARRPSVALSRGRSKKQRAEEAARAKRMARAEKRRKRDATPTITRLHAYRVKNDASVDRVRAKMTALREKIDSGRGYSIIPNVGRRQRAADEESVVALQKELDTELYWKGQIDVGVNALSSVYAQYMALKDTIERGKLLAAARATERDAGAEMGAEEKVSRLVWREVAAEVAAKSRVSMMLEDRRRLAMVNALQCEAAVTLVDRPAPPLKELTHRVYLLGAGDRLVLKDYFLWIGGKDPAQVDAEAEGNNASIFAVAAEDGGPPPPPVDAGPPWVEGEDEAWMAVEGGGGSGGDGRGSPTKQPGLSEVTGAADADSSDDLPGSPRSVGSALGSPRSDGSPRSNGSPRSDGSPTKKLGRLSRRGRREAKARAAAEAQRRRIWRAKRKSQEWLIREDELGDPEMFFILLRVSRDLGLGSLTEDLIERFLAFVEIKFEMLPSERDGKRVWIGDGRHDGHDGRPSSAGSLGSAGLGSDSSPRTRLSASVGVGGVGGDDALSLPSEKTTWSRVTMSTGYRELLAELSDELESVVGSDEESVHEDKSPEQIE